MPFTVELVQTSRAREHDGFGVGGQTVASRVQTVQVTGATRHHATVQPISAGVSAQDIALAPLVASQPGSLLWLQANQPLDLQLGAVGPTISNVVSLVLAASAAISALFVTNPNSTTDAVLRLELIGGGSLQAAVPVP